jgi:hypothetical protein
VFYGYGLQSVKTEGRVAARPRQRLKRHPAAAAAGIVRGDAVDLPGAPTLYGNPRHASMIEQP